MMLVAGSSLAADPAPQPQAPKAQAATAPAATAPSDPSRMSQSEIDLLQALTARREALDQREQTVAAREATAAAAEARLAARTDELNKLKADLETLAAQRKAADDAGLARVVKIYEGMKPADAGRVLADMDTDGAAAILMRMKEAKVAPVLAAMDPTKAREITGKLVGRPAAKPGT